MSNIPSLYPEALAQALYAPFEVKAFANPKVAWLSHRYWIGEGVDSAAPEIRSQLEADLLGRYAFAVPDPRDPDELFTGKTRQFHADRYGAAAGARHGGSGRAGDCDGFNVKGIGRTPLVDPHAPWDHAHGHMWLEEAIRDAIYSEFAQLECPKPGSRIVAIIDTGTRATTKDGQPGDRRAIVVRTAGLRFAHLERSILFGSGGTPDSEQYKDAARVEAAFQYIAAKARQSGQGLSSFLQNAFYQVAEHIGYARCWRIGYDFFSSNVLLNGGLMDFGGFSFLASWHHAWRETDADAAQRDFDAFVSSMQIISFNAAKYLPGEAPLDAAHLMTRFEGRVQSAFETEIEQICAPLWEHFPHMISNIQDILAAHYAQAQSLIDDYTVGPEGHHPRQWVVGPRLAPQDWIYAGLNGDDLGPGDDHGVHTGQQLRRMLTAPVGTASARQDADLRVCYSNLLRWARPRGAGTRQVIHGKIYRWSLTQSAAPEGKRLQLLLDQYVSHTLTRIRRSFAPLGEHEIITACAVTNTAELLICHDIVQDRPSLHIHAMRLGSRVFLNADCVVDEAAVAAYATGMGPTGITLTIPLAANIGAAPTFPDWLPTARMPRWVNF